MSEHEAEIHAHWFEDDGDIPNNPNFPLLVYLDVIPTAEDATAWCRERLTRNGWGGSWVNGVFGYHHYHSNAHEFLGVVRGSARLLLGGADGVEIEVTDGDALVLPAGTGHKRLSSDTEFRVLGAYPGGKEYDMNTGESDERPDVLENIEQVGLPGCDPLFGADGPLREHWTET